MADMVIAGLNPTLARLEAGVQGAQGGLERVEAGRRAAGDDAEKNLSWYEWLIIGGSILGSAFGVNTLRDRKYVARAANGGGTPKVS